VTKSESVMPQTVEEQNHKANVLDEFVVDVDQNCGPEEDVQKGSGLRVVFHDLAFHTCDGSIWEMEKVG
jgi:hypothetical protein